ncbi:zinc transporter ZIP1-like [Haliotis cracherodii]|uniref:zinc transporter ZIP1-like n=1 Tax=Haliotis cracherodii TaxID=6455 RepID=UPI0039E7CAB7
MLSLLVVKVIVLFVLFFLTFTLGFIPLKLIRVFRKRSSSQNFNSELTQIGSSQESRPGYKRVISFLSCFAAGVFLATCFLDLLPDVRRKLTNVLDVMEIYTGFPVAEFVMVIGLFAVLITEQIVISVKERHSSARGDRAPLLAGGGVDWQKSATESTRSQHSIAGISDQPHIEHKNSEIQDSEYEEPETDQDPNYKGSRANHCRQNEEHVHSSMRAFLLLVALSLHSIFEGLAVGLQTETGNVLGIFAALVLHKSILSFSLGMNLVQTNLSSKLMLRSILFFSMTAPLGVGIGIGIIHLWDSTASSFVQGLLQGLACGTFLYITFFEVLPHEFNSHHDRMLKVLFLLLGYSTVTGILFLSDSVRKPFCPVKPSVNGSNIG